MGGMMSRKGNTAKRLLVGITLAALLVLVSCEDLAMLMDNLEDEVMLANDRYLEVTDIFPRQNATFVNPGQDILISFDKDVNPDDALSSITIVDSQGNIVGLGPDDAEFDRVTKTLAIKPNPYLEDSRQYTVIVDTSMVSTSGNPIREEFTSFFATGTYPKGTFLIRDDVASTGLIPGFTRTFDVPLEITRSAIDDFHVSIDMPLANTVVEKENLIWTAESVIGDISSATGEANPGIILELDNGAWTTPGDGPVSIYMMFRDNQGNYSPIESGETFLDRTPPKAEAGDNVGPINSAYARTGSGTDPGYPGSGSGIDKNGYSWSASAGMSVTNGSTQTDTFTGPADTDQLYTVTVTVHDKAGNPHTDSFVIDWDTVIPNPPSVGGATPTTGDPSWSWTSSSSSDAVGTYRRSLNGGTWYTTTSTSYRPRGLPDGRHRLSVRQYDDAGNLSNADTHEILKNSAGIVPYDGQTNVLRSLTFDWPDTFGIVTYGIVLYTRSGKNWVEATRVTGLSVSEYSVPSPLPASTEWGWKYLVSSKGGTNYSPLYTFTTGTK